MVEEAQTTIHWKCNTCDQTEGVENGVCPNCGATQTTPVSDEAKKEAGIVVDEKKEVEEDNTQNSTSK